MFRVDLAGAKVSVAGAGVVGSAVALAAARAGATVRLYDPAPIGANASGVAAGMLAPAFESLDEPEAAARFGLLKSARDAWPNFAEGLALGLVRCGALFVGADSAAVAEALARLGAEVEQGPGRAFTPEDWRLEPMAGLAAMQAELRRLGGELIGEAAPQSQQAESDAFIVACGYGGRTFAPELRGLIPIRGQLLCFPGVSLDGPIRRGVGGYVVPSERGAICGATMDRGRTDLAPEEAASRRLAALAAELAPQLDGQAFEARVGLRAARPGGLPIAGPSSAPGVWLAGAARRNGWLFAPLIAEILVQAIGGDRGHPLAAAFDPAPLREAIPG